MIPAQRRAVLLDFIKKCGAALIKELVRHSLFFKSTMRRDLDFLNRQSYLKRSYEGANLPTFLNIMFEPGFATGAYQNHEAKRAIGKLAAERMENGCGVDFRLQFDSARGSQRSGRTLRPRPILRPKVF